MKLRMMSLMFAYALVACSHDEPVKDPSTTGAAMTATSPAEATDGTTVRSDSTATTTGAATETPVPTTTHTTPTTPSPNATTSTTAPTTATPPTSPPPATAGTANRAPDNTTVNDRDRGSTATPMTQGNSESEVKITAAIRRSVMGDGTLGFNAKNVKIITVGTKVTLRGPVANEHERTAIGAYARQAAGVTAVDNQLEVTK